MTALSTRSVKWAAADSPRGTILPRNLRQTLRAGESGAYALALVRQRW